MQPSNFLLMKNNPLSTAAQLRASAPAAGAAAVYNSLTGAHMAQSDAAACEPAPAPAEEVAPYEGGWLKGVDFGCSNEAPPGALLCKMTVRESPRLAALNRGLVKYVAGRLQDV